MSKTTLPPITVSWVKVGDKMIAILEKEEWDKVVNVISMVADIDTKVSVITEEEFVEKLAS